jgi:hypothetical protein
MIKPILLHWYYSQADLTWLDDFFKQFYFWEHFKPTQPSFECTVQKEKSKNPPLSFE